MFRLERWPLAKNVRNQLAKQAAEPLALIQVNMQINSYLYWYRERATIIIKLHNIRDKLKSFATVFIQVTYG